MKARAVEQKNEEESLVQRCSSKSNMVYMHVVKCLKREDKNFKE